MEFLSLEMFKSNLDVVLDNLLKVSLPEQEGRARWPPEAPSNFNLPVIL